MADSGQLEIARINLTVTSPLPVRREREAAYQPFLRRSDERAIVDINISLELGMPSTAGLARLFDGRAWVMYRDAQFSYLQSYSSALQEPEWLARFVPDMRQVTVYCGDQLMSRLGDTPFLSNPICYPLDQLLLIYALAQHGGALIHAAGASIAGKGYLFAGPSGAGKSTLSRQLARCQDIRLLSGRPHDRPPD